MTEMNDNQKEWGCEKNLLLHDAHHEVVSVEHFISLWSFLCLQADRALELGYERDVRSIINALDEQQKPEETEEGETEPKPSGSSRQTLLCSATLTTGIEQLSEISLRHPGAIFIC